MSSVITLQNVSKRFGVTQALDQVSLEIPSGIVFALLGENGAGKTTMIRILTGFQTPDLGVATVLGHNCVEAGAEIRRAIGYVSDAPALYDWMTADEIGWFTSAFYDDQFAPRYLELLAAFDVPSMTKIMSKGQRAKVALALATAHDPQLLILDEPTSGLDPMVRRQFLESMVDRAALGRTVLLSSHQINEVERVADWIGIVHAGQLKLVQPLEVLKESTHIVTATLDHESATVALPPGDVLSETRNGRQLRWIIRDLPDSWRSVYDDESGIKDLSQQPATLEEIFIAVCDRRAVRPQATSQHTGPQIGQQIGPESKSPVAARTQTF
jgi:ABC-2 type transport system ATP-binding protein